MIIKAAGAIDTVPPQPACATYNAGKVSFCGATDDTVQQQVISWVEHSTSGERSFVSGWGLQAPSDTTVGGAVLTGEVLTLFANVPGAKGKTNQFRLRARAITSMRTYNVRSYLTDLGVGVYVVDNSLRYATSNASSMVGFSPTVAPRTLTIPLLTSHRVEGSFTFSLYRGSNLVYKISSNFIGARE